MPVPSPMVSVIVPTFNRPRFLPRALASLRSQSFQDFEVIVVNDCGTSVESIVLEAGLDGKVAYLRLAENVKLPGARNAALRMARGRYIAYLDDDDRFLPDHLAVLVNALQAGARVAYSDARRVYEKEVHGDYVATTSDVPYSRDFDAAQILLTNFIPVTCVVHERSLLEESGPFDASLPVLEDWDLWIRMSRVADFVHVPTVTCEFFARSDGSSMTSSLRETFKRVEHEIFIRYVHHVRQVPGARDALFRYQHAHVETLVRAGRLDEAVDLLERMTATEPDFPPSLLLLSVLYEGRGRLAEAIDVLERARVHAPDRREIVIALERARAGHPTSGR